MRRVQKKIDRNRSNIFKRDFVPHSALSPEVYVEQIWLDEGVNPGVQIIELNSSGNSEPSPESKSNRKATDAWKHIAEELLHDLDNTYVVNEEARARRRMKDTAAFNEWNNENPKRFDDGEDNLYFNNNSYDYDIENVAYNDQSKCFSEVNEACAVHEGFSNGDLFNVDEVQDSSENWFFNKSAYSDEVVGNEDNIDSEKRTIWIYSFKNKHLLSENDYDIDNIPGKGSSSSSGESPEVEDSKHNNGKNTSRAATPIPSQYSVPRLNLFLSPSLLPTVTEITEPRKKSCSIQTGKDLKENTNIQEKLLNSWFRSENATPSKGYNAKSATNNVVNWMALSPREKRRKFRNINTQLPVVREVSTYAEDKVQYMKGEGNLCSGNTTIHSVDIKMLTKLHDKCTQTEKCAQRANTLATATSGESLVSLIDDIDVVVAKESPSDRGDYKTNKKVQKLHIRCSRPVPHKPIISDPIEKLESNNWIVEEPLKDDDKGNPHRPVSCAGNTLLIKNLNLLKPAQWSQYLPITESVPSLHLSLSTDSIDRRSWWKRLLLCFRCYK